MHLTTCVAFALLSAFAGLKLARGDELADLSYRLAQRIEALGELLAAEERDDQAVIDEVQSIDLSDLKREIKALKKDAEGDVKKAARNLDKKVKKLDRTLSSIVEDGVTSKAVKNLKRQVEALEAEEPAAPEATEAPGAPEATEEPAGPEATEAPGAPEATDAPAVPEATEAPAAPEATDAPAEPEPTEPAGPVHECDLSPLPENFYKDPRTDYCYYIHEGEGDWEAARASCQQYGMEMVILDIWEDEQFVKGIIADYDTASWWIGAVRDEMMYNMVWYPTHNPTGWPEYREVAMHMNWVTGFADWEGDCAYMSRDMEYRWDTVDCDRSFAVICQKGWIPDNW